jgi:tetraacyldisaccharide 4'-kinase
MKTPSWFLKRNFIAWLLLPASWLYFLISRPVFFYRSFWQKSSKTPVICVGGILAGGVGKTPVVREIAKMFPNSAVVMRGYGGIGAGEGGLVRHDDSALAVGDEAKMLSGSGLPVFVGSDRQKNIKSAEKAGFSFIIMDDGFQNPGVKKDVSILVFDAEIGVGNGFMLPAGPLREPLSAIARADAVVIIGGKGQAARRRLPELVKKYKKPVFFAKKEVADIGLRGRVAVFAGIGYPAKFFNDVKKFDMSRVTDIAFLPFPDHHKYSAADMHWLECRALGDSENKGGACAGKKPACLVTTEKDFVRIPDFSHKKDVRFVPLKITFDPEFETWLKRRLK